MSKTTKALAKKPLPQTLAVVRHSGVQERRRGLAFTRKLTFEEWKKIGEGLVRVETGVGWSLGDWYNFGKSTYGKRALEAKATAEKHGLSVKTVQNYASTAAAFPPSQRRENLSLAHHQEVQAMPEKERERWLDRASKKKLSAAALHRAIHEVRAKAVLLPLNPTLALATHAATGTTHEDEPFEEEREDGEEMPVCEKCGQPIRATVLS